MLTEKMSAVNLQIEKIKQVKDRPSFEDLEKRLEDKIFRQNMVILV